MNYFIAIEPPSDGDAGYGVVVPDFDGCFSQGDTVDEAIKNAKESIELWIAGMFDEGLPISAPRSYEEIIKAAPDLKNCIFAIVDIDPAALSDKAERINITLPARVLRRLDIQASKANDTRSGHIARLVIEEAWR